LCRQIETGVDKSAVVDTLLLKKAASGQGSRFADRSLSVYVGDSMSDLAPLLAVDLGIVIGQNKLLKRVSRAAGITLKPLVTGLHP
jgi:2-hydroxy-3-keto-5-methylthiopentenyl-1-phosphate phosphatase